MGLIRKKFDTSLKAVEAIIRDLLGPLTQGDDPEINIRNRKILGIGIRISIIVAALVIGYLLIGLLAMILGT